MRRTFPFVTIAFLAGLTIGFLADRAGLGKFRGKDRHAADLAAIEKLHQADVEATMKQDPKDLTTLWSEDAVNLGFATPAVGIKSIQLAFEKFRKDYPDFQVVNYAPEIKETLFADEWAVEVGNFAGTYKMSAKENPVSVEGKGIRVLKRQADGSWKFALVGLK